MGYRSDVAYTIRFESNTYNTTKDKNAEEKAKESFYTFIAEAKANEDTAYCFSEDEDGVFQVLEDKLEIRFFAESVKWYEEFPEVKCHEALVSLSKSWADDNDYIGGAFARVGEDTNDNVEEVWGQADWNWISVARSICVDWE